MTTHRLLLADADPICRAFLVDNLTADGYAVKAVDCDRAAIAHMRHSDVDLMLADVNGTTLALVDWIRAGGDTMGRCACDVPIVVLRTTDDRLERVRLLERGADDVILKPFSYTELRARVGAVLRRAQPRRARPVTSAGPLHIDHSTRAVTVEDRRVRLSDTEYRLLCQLASDPTRVFTRQELLRDVWGYQCEARTRTLDSHAHRLRRRLESATPLVLNVWGVGYQLMSATA